MAAVTVTNTGTASTFCTSTDARGNYVVILISVGKTSVVLGAGIVGWPAFSAGAKNAPMKVYYTEDKSPFAPAQVPKRLDYLKLFKMWKFLGR